MLEVPRWYGRSDLDAPTSPGAASFLCDEWSSRRSTCVKTRHLLSGHILRRRRVNTGYTVLH